ncbi:EAL domain-containing protein [Alkalimarinus coralli]|uniref:EAL domain-containing protein n=1 Tax=Alkalimarinus coralli TaxID=2935863 RepID=UPI00202B1171|nr:EAL domain-containing protein [Alkalimarinus coralli]
MSFLASIGSVWWVPVLIAAGLIPVNAYNPLLFHTLSELFAIGIAIISFVVAWNTYSLSRNNYLMFLGVGYFWVGTLDFFHTLTFTGLPFFSVYDANPTLQIWIIARYFEALVLLVAPLFIARQLNRRRAFLYCGAISTAALIAVANKWVPVMHIAGSGLQPVKVISEYIIVTILILAVMALWHERKNIDKHVLRVIDASIVFTIAAELSFTLYSDFQGIMLMVGHLLKLFSFWGIYVALIESSLKEPFKNLSREANTYDAVPDETVVIDAKGIVRQVNEAVRQTTKLSTAECVGCHCHELLHPASLSIDDCQVCRAVLEQTPLRSFEFFDPESESWFEATLTNIHYVGETAGMVHVRRNITKRKVAQEKVASLNRLYTVLSHTNKAILLAKNREEMFQRICDIAIQKGGFKMAWIGVIKDDVVSPQSFAGDEHGYLKDMEMRVDDSVLARGPVGQAAKRAQVCYVNDVLTDPDFSPWREAAIERGYRALAAVPLRFGGEVMGIFTIYSAAPNVFDSEMFGLLSSLSDDISAAIRHIDHEQRRVAAEKKLRQLSQAVEQSSNAIIITDTQGDIEYVNRSFTQLTGYKLEEVVGKTPQLLKSEHSSAEVSKEIWHTLLAGDEWNGELQNRKKDGTLYWSLQSISPIRDEQGNVTHYLSTQEDNTELHEAQETIKKLAFYDPLTSLPNRRLLNDRLDQAIASAKRYPHQMVAVMLFDLDNFKRVNDSLGHKYGDLVLQHVAKSFSGIVREEDTVSRLGGDEFTVVLRGMPGIDQIIDIATLFINKLAEPIELMGNQVIVGTSIGIAVYPQDANDADTLMRNADMAMYHAKAEGKHNFQFYKEEMNSKAQERLLLENKLRHAIESGHFVLHYQPQVDLRTKELIGLEALIRWVDPIQGVISPLTFIPLAEETGMIGKIGDWVISQACEENRRLQKNGFPAVKVAVNVSAYQFRHGDHLCRVIQNSLEATELNPAHLSVELTESILIEDVEGTIAQLNKLKALGITLAVDDFGTGYSSLSYLKRFPIDILKIDQSFIRDILDDANDEAIVNAIIGMGRSLGLTVLAEGVETVAHRDYLIQQQCHFAQGYLYCKPKPADELLACWQAGSLLL